MEIQAWLHHAASMGEQMLAAMGVFLVMYLANRFLERRELTRRWADDERRAGSPQGLPATCDAESDDSSPIAAVAHRT